MAQPPKSIVLQRSEQNGRNGLAVDQGVFALERGVTHYTSNFGYLELRKALAKYVGKKFGANYNPDNEILITVGVSEALDLALRALITPGDEVLYHEP